MLVAWFDSIWVCRDEHELYDDKIVKCVFLVSDLGSSSKRMGGWEI